MIPSGPESSWSTGPRKAPARTRLDPQPQDLLNEAMTEVFFYHLEHQSLDRILPRLLQASISRGWRVVVQTGSAERAEALSAWG